PTVPSEQQTRFRLPALIMRMETRRSVSTSSYVGVYPLTRHSTYLLWKKAIHTDPSYNVDIE
ncbi:hypothetical protein, partial [Paenibacillus larvae]|uniref:hypothetical protein n=1 Tax=Paenibacillus larvae TaxID=1464 RepID=UPI001ED948EF